MKKMCVLVLVLVVGTVGCSTLEAPKAHFQGMADLNGEGAAVSLNPQAYDVKEVGPVQGEAYVTKFMGMRVGGDRPESEVTSIFGTGNGVPRLGSLAEIAAAKAVSSKAGADGIYVLHSNKEYQSVFFGMWNRTTVTVKGRAMSLTPGTASENDVKVGIEVQGRATSK